MDVSVIRPKGAIYNNNTRDCCTEYKQREECESLANVKHWVKLKISIEYENNLKTKGFIDVKLEESKI